MCTVKTSVQLKKKYTWSILYTAPGCVPSIVLIFVFDKCIFTKTKYYKSTDLRQLYYLADTLLTEASSSEVAF